jgi:hypothetical protein
MEEMIIAAITTEEAEVIHKRRVTKAKEVLIKTKTEEIGKIFREIKALGGDVVYRAHRYVGVGHMNEPQVCGMTVVFE